MKDYITTSEDGFILRIRLTPGAARESLGGLQADEKGQQWLKAAVTAVPEKGRANAALVALLSKKLKIRKGAFALTSGETDRYKIFSVSQSCNESLIRQYAQPSTS